MARVLAEHPRLPALAVILVCLGALGTAYASQVWGGLEPCILCIYQRYAFGAALLAGLAGLMLGGAPRPRRAALGLAGLAFFAGAAIAAFHVGVEQHWWQGTADCHAAPLEPGLSVAELRERLLETAVVPCDRIPWSFLGVSMAGYNAVFSLVLAVLTWWAVGRDGRQQTA